MHFSATITTTNESATEKSCEFKNHVYTMYLFIEIIEKSRHICWIYRRVIMHGVLFYNKLKCVVVNVGKQHLNIHVEFCSVWLWIINYVGHVSNLSNGSMSIKKNTKNSNYLSFFRPFEYLVLFTIFCNCAALALSKPLPSNDTTPTNSILVNLVLMNSMIDLSICKSLGTNWIYFFGNIYTWSYPENHSIWFMSPSECIFTEWMEFTRFYNCCCRVKIQIDFVYLTKPRLICWQISKCDIGSI